MLLKLEIFQLTVGILHQHQHQFQTKISNRTRKKWDMYVMILLLLS